MTRTKQKTVMVRIKVSDKKKLDFLAKHYYKDSLPNTLENVISTFQWFILRQWYKSSEVAKAVQKVLNKEGNKNE